ncbi:MAG: hypothetical protein OEZ65_02560 [Gemmatimonadota bacterium]|nr:hypothetical protein [Gemmatimonadota bacterium]MDH5758444.1 hypothetical protein [Gemmatimonadota bacterium]
MDTSASTLRPIAPGLAALFVVVALTDCASAPTSGNTLPAHMYAHYRQVGEIQTAVIRGEMESVRQPARWLATHEDHPDLPRGVLSPMDELRREARRVEISTTLEEAALGAAALGATCGTCHEAAGAGPRLEVRSMPARGMDTQGHMLRHLWAADRMWEGLIGPSDETWMAGAVALSEAPLHLEGGAEAPGEVSRLAAEVHTLGTEAHRTRDHSRRAGIYGRLLATCSRCHTLLEVS